MESLMRDLAKAGMFRGIPTSTASLKTADKTLEDIDLVLEECDLKHERT